MRLMDCCRFSCGNEVTVAEMSSLLLLLWTAMSCFTTVWQTSRCFSRNDRRNETFPLNALLFPCVTHRWDRALRQHWQGEPQLSPWQHLKHIEWRVIRGRKQIFSHKLASMGATQINHNIPPPSRDPPVSEQPVYKHSEMDFFTNVVVSLWLLDWKRFLSRLWTHKRRKRIHVSRLVIDMTGCPPLHTIGWRYDQSEKRWRWRHRRNESMAECWRREGCRYPVCSPEHDLYDLLCTGKDWNKLSL